MDRMTVSPRCKTNKNNSGNPFTEIPCLILYDCLLKAFQIPDWSKNHTYNQVQEALFQHHKLTQKTGICSMNCSKHQEKAGGKEKSLSMRDLPSILKRRAPSLARARGTIAAWHSAGPWPHVLPHKLFTRMTTCELNNIPLRENNYFQRPFI